MRPVIGLGLSVALACTTGEPADGQSREWRTDFSQHTVPLEEIVPGGPPKDGIPAIDDPRFVSAEEADGWLDDREPVVLVTRGTAVKAYPLQILIWHEIVNDEIDGIPIVVTYCPLCNTALAFDRRFDGRLLDFGTTGRLRHSDLVMYDRQTESWWQQATGEGIVGRYAGERLRFISAPLVSWETVKDTHPDARVLSRDTGFPSYRRRYGTSPYAGYDDPGGGPWQRFFRRRTDDRLPAMERVVAVSVDEETVAYPFSALAERRVIHDEVENRPIVVLWAPGTASAVDQTRIGDGRDVGASGVFDRRLGTRTLTFEAAGDGRWRDRETGSTWNVLGHATTGELEGSRLEPVTHGNHFWFAWAVFKPETRIVRQ
ncbi:MAG: DUF3179 domain-containing protein [Gemmatimonadales bacterium]|jgi:hypothetical protein